jgi:hypothetical protein
MSNGRYPGEVPTTSVPRDFAAAMLDAGREPPPVEPSSDPLVVLIEHAEVAMDTASRQPSTAATLFNTSTSGVGGYE